MLDFSGRMNDRKERALDGWWSPRQAGRDRLTPQAGRSRQSHSQPSVEAPWRQI